MSSEARTPGIDLASRVRVPADVVFHELQGEGVVLDIQGGSYYGLDAVGTRMWLHLAERGRLEDAFRSLLDEYEVEADRLRRDLLDFVDGLVAQGLLDLE